MFEEEHPFSSEVVLLLNKMTLKEVKRPRALRCSNGPRPSDAAIGASVALRFVDSRRIPIASHSSLSQILFPISQLRI